MKTILTREKNIIIGLIYKDDPTIFVWKLVNEPSSLEQFGKQI